MQIRELLEAVRSGDVPVAEAEAILRRPPVADIGCARLDLNRAVRAGYPEVVFCQGKADEHLIKIFQTLHGTNGEVLGTRAAEEQYKKVREAMPAVEVEYDKLSRILKIEKQDKKKRGLIVVCTAGTADIPVAEEAAQTAEFFGNRVERVFDAGVTGIHRLLDKAELLQKANCVIAIAGMEGALASVIGGLVDKPVIAVPTSVGYGASFHGLSALLTMINSCANSVAVVNIDNGYGAGFIAGQINRLGVKNE